MILLESKVLSLLEPFHLFSHFIMNQDQESQDHKARIPTVVIYNDYIFSNSCTEAFGTHRTHVSLLCYMSNMCVWSSRNKIEKLLLVSGALTIRGSGEPELLPVAKYVFKGQVDC